MMADPTDSKPDAAAAIPGPLFDRVALIGLGLIGSSLGRVMKRKSLAGVIAGTARTEATRRKALLLDAIDQAFDDALACVGDADLWIGSIARFTGKLEGNHSRDVPLQRQHLQVEH